MTAPPRMHLQERDIACLRDIGEAAVLDTKTIQDRHFPNDKSGRACLRRLRLYKAHNLIETVHIAVARTDRVGRMPAIHRLTQDGAELLHAEAGIMSLRTVRSDPPKPHTLLHRLGMAKVMLAMNDACKLQELPRPEWILEYDARQNLPPTARLSERYILCREFPLADGGLRRCWPDAACLLTIPHQGKDWRMVILWEFDRSTEGRGQLLEKVPGYESLLATAAWRQLFAEAHTVRILFAVPSRQRLAMLSDVFRNTSIEGHVRIGVTADIQSCQALTLPIWITPAGNSRPLLSSSSDSSPSQQSTGRSASCSLTTICSRL